MIQAPPGVDSSVWTNAVYKLATLRNFAFSNMDDGSAASKSKSNVVRDLRKMAKAVQAGRRPAFAENQEEARFLTDQPHHSVQRVTLVDGGTLEGCLRHEDVKEPGKDDDPLTWDPVRSWTLEEFRRRVTRLIHHLGDGQNTLVIVLDADTPDKSPLKAFERIKRAKTNASSDLRRSGILHSYGFSDGAREAFGSRYFSPEFSHATEAAKKAAGAPDPHLPEWVSQLVPLRTMLTADNPAKTFMPGPLSGVWSSRAVGRPELRAEVLIDGVRSYISAPAGKRLIITGAEACRPLIERLVDEGEVDAAVFQDNLDRAPPGTSIALIVGDGQGIEVSHVPYYGEADQGLMQALSWKACSHGSHVRVVSNDSDILLLLLLYYAHVYAPPDPAYGERWATTASIARADGPDLANLTLAYKITSTHEAKSTSVHITSLSVSRVAAYLAIALRKIHGSGSASNEQIIAMSAAQNSDIMASLVVYLYYMGIGDYLYGFPGIGEKSMLYALQKCNVVVHAGRPLVSVAVIPAPGQAALSPILHNPRHELVKVAERARMPVFRVNTDMLDRATAITMSVARVVSKRNAKDTLSPREALNAFLLAENNEESTAKILKSTSGKIRREYVVEMDAGEANAVLHYKATNQPLSKFDGTQEGALELIEKQLKKKTQPTALLLPATGEVAMRFSAALAAASLMSQAVAGMEVDQWAVVHCVLEGTAEESDIRYAYMTH